MNEFFELWRQRAVNNPGDYVVTLWDGAKYVDYFTSLTVAVAFAETSWNDHDYNPDTLEIFDSTKDKPRFAVAKGEPSCGSPLHPGYVILFSVKAHPTHNKKWNVYLS